MANKHTFKLLLVAFCIVLLSTSKQYAQATKPTIGLGSGMFTFYGDVSKGKKDNGATISRMAIDLHITQPITSYLDGSFFFLKGKVGANERSGIRNVNFLSDISIWGVKGSYNFDNFLPKDRYISPYVSLGIESIEFLSKTDLKDANDNVYHYWQDGTIRDIAENSENSGNAQRLQRDYTFESDVRNTNIDSLGKYKERSFGVPIGIGVRMKLTEQFSFDLGTSFHFTGTDFIDGITENSIGNRQGDKKNDNLLFTSFKLNYNINPTEPIDLTRPPLDPDDMLAGDEDADGVIDFYDLCPGTPELVEVNEDGCPLDTDLDGVPDYLDEEINTPEGLPVNKFGIALTDEDYLEMYARYSDTTSQGTGIYDTLYTVSYSEGADKVQKDNYMVKIGEFTGGLPQDVAEELLSIPDVNTWEENGTTYITVGNYDNIPDALKRQLELNRKGFVKSSLVQTSRAGVLTGVEPGDETTEYLAPTEITDPVDEVVYRVQIGAFRKRIRKQVFRDVPGVMMIPFDDGINRYVTGSYSTMQEAAKAKIDLMTKGYQNAFIVTFKNGKRISVSQAGAKLVDDIYSVNEAKKNSAPSSFMENGSVTFSVQIGAYRGEVPADILKTILTLENIQRERTKENLIRYFSGNFKSSAEAQAFRTELESKGIPNPSVIGRFKNSTITEQEAIELQK